MLSILAPDTGYCHNLIRRTLDVGKETSKTREKRIRRILEDSRKKIQPIYSAKGEIIEYDKHGKHLDVYG